MRGTDGWSDQIEGVLYEGQYLDERRTAPVEFTDTPEVAVEDIRGRAVRAATWPADLRALDRLSCFSRRLPKATFTDTRKNRRLAQVQSGQNAYRSSLLRRRVDAAMSEASRREVRAGLEPSLARLWRYALVLSRARDVAEDLVQATCLRAIERADQFVPGTKVDRWLFAILRSTWLNEIRSRRIREGGGLVNHKDVLTTDGVREIETNIAASAVLRAIKQLPEAQREIVLLVYGERYTYAEAAAVLAVPIGTVMSRLATARGALAKLK
jgi:RNA polymerase sigma-70 factor (ECF subfamily)